MTYLFLAIPNFCGSTLIHSLLETCPAVTGLTATVTRNMPDEDFKEGNACTKNAYFYNSNRVFKSIEAMVADIIADPKWCLWDSIKQQWDENWERTNPKATIRLQKTPSDIYRIASMKDYFPNLKWILAVRNPYHYAESIISRRQFRTDPFAPDRFAQICFHITKVMEIQKANAELLGKDVYVMTYDDFCVRPEYHVELLGKFLPGLEQIDLNAAIKVKGELISKIENRGEEKFQLMCKEYPDLLAKLNFHFEPKREIIEHWGYSLK